MPTTHQQVMDALEAIGKEHVEAENSLYEQTKAKKILVQTQCARLGHMYALRANWFSPAIYQAGRQCVFCCSAEGAPDIPQPEAKAA